MTRQRLIDVLDDRFRARLTTVVGAAGSGKTTLMAQVLAVDSDDVDVWYPCSTADRETARFLRGVVDATADELDDYRPGESTDLLGDLRELVLGVSPRQVCIIVDDVHLLGQADGLTELLASLPRNGHLLASGRSLPGSMSRDSTRSASSSRSTRTT